jgi:hypothetical protein
MQTHTILQILQIRKKYKRTQSYTKVPPDGRGVGWRTRWASLFRPLARAGTSQRDVPTTGGGDIAQKLPGGCVYYCLAGKRALPHYARPVVVPRGCVLK